MTRITHSYIPIFSITLILSAFLLFSVQPMFGKMILPLLGGTPGVWNTAMVFFQAMLLAGYAYAHLTTKLLSVRMQAVLHVALLLLCVLALPLAIPEEWKHPPATENPISWLLGLMTLAVGGPFFVLAGTAPMLQRWFSTTGHPDAHNPYFLYAASNLGSMVALVSYPLLIEPLLGLRQQSLFWMIGYICLIGMIASAGFVTRNSSGSAPFNPLHPANSTTPTMKMRLTWLMLALIPSSLMLGVTTYITTDIASAPLLWVIPLALYLITFIIVFSRHVRLSIPRAYHWQSLALILVAALFVRDPFTVKAISVCVHLAAFFFCTLTCHLALSHRRPTPEHLTEFYLIMSLGGVLGGIFNSLFAPLLFVIPLEYALMLCVSLVAPFIAGDMVFRFKDILTDYRMILMGVGAALLAMVLTKAASIGIIMTITIAFSLIVLLKHKSSFILTLLAVIALDPGFNWMSLAQTQHMERNFFGTLRVAYSDQGGMRTLLHGTTLHGTQALSEDYRLIPVSYYAEKNPGGQVFSMVAKLKGEEPQKMAILGLGLGSVACHTHPNRSFVFYEIDPAIRKIAEDRNLFTYLSDCGSPYEVIMGDGRLRIAEAADHSYDMIFLDAFSSDSIPIHLLTKEAFDIYFRKLKPEGIIVAHISNRFLDLSPLINSIGREMGAHVWFNSNNSSIIAAPDITAHASVFGVMTKGKTMERLIETEFSQWRPYTGSETRPWTDDYANILSLMWLKVQDPLNSLPK